MFYLYNKTTSSKKGLETGTNVIRLEARPQL